MIRRAGKQVNQDIGDTGYIKGNKGFPVRVLWIMFGCWFLAACNPSEPVSTALVILPTETHTPIFTSTHLVPTLTETPVPVTPQPTLRPSPTPTATLPPGYVRYKTQSGDTFEVLAARFGTTWDRILCVDSEMPCPEEPSGQLIPEGVTLLIPELEQEAAWTLSPRHRFLPDSEFVYSVAAVDFDLAGYLDQTEGFLKDHRQYLMVNGWNSGAELVQMVALENSVNPRLLLALLEYQCGCVLDNPGSVEKIEPFLKITSEQYFRSDLWGQLDMAVNRLWVGYAGWREGTLTAFALKDGTLVRPAPMLNAGTVAVQYFFAGLYGWEDWQAALDMATGFPALFERMFGAPWKRGLEIFPPQAAQPTFILPFEQGTTWSYTGGPHPSFDGNGPLASLDFAPALAEPGCWQTDAWVLAVADGVVVRVDPGLVMLDLDGDGLEQTGWNVMYLHIEARDRVQLGTVLKAGERIGHPSCEGGVASGTHVHLARKFNGEWIAADSPLPFNLGGWVAHNGEKPYLGTLVRGEDVLIACTCSWEKGWVVVRE